VYVGDGTAINASGPATHVHARVACAASLALGLAFSAFPFERLHAQASDAPPSGAGIDARASQAPSDNAGAAAQPPGVQAGYPNVDAQAPQAPAGAASGEADPSQAPAATDAAAQGSEAPAGAAGTEAQAAQTPADGSGAAAQPSETQAGYPNVDAQASRASTDNAGGAVDPTAAPADTVVAAQAPETPAVEPAAADTEAGTPAAESATVASQPLEPPSGTAAEIADWVSATGDNGGLPFMIIDKVAADIFVFGADGRLQGEAPVLVGLATGDDSAPGIGDVPLSAIRPEERTTPAGRFVTMFGPAKGDKTVLWVDYPDSISLHPVVTSNPKEHRLQRIASSAPEDHRISYGCINVPASFYQDVVLPVLGSGKAVVYILPETKPIEDVFPGFALARETSGVAGGADPAHGSAQAEDRDRPSESTDASEQASRSQEPIIVASGGFDMPARQGVVQASSFDRPFSPNDAVNGASAGQSPVNPARGGSDSPPDPNADFDNSTRPHAPLHDPTSGFGPGATAR
jgi:hypothetical protein